MKKDSKMSITSKKKMSESHKGKILSKKHRKKISEKMKGKKNTLGRKQSESEKRKRSETSKRLGLIPPNHLGKKQSEESNKKRSIALTGRKQSEEHRRKNSKSHKGKRPSNYKGGISTENTKIRTSIEYDLWRSAIFARDGYTCQKYGIKGGKLVAHHILNFSEHIELRFAIDNGITLSEKAHLEFHKIYGKKNNTREQLLEFLNENK